MECCQLDSFSIRGNIERDANLDPPKELAEGGGDVELPYALAAKYPKAAREWGWQYVFPAKDKSVDPRSGAVRRHHVDEQVLQRAMREARSGGSHRHRETRPCAYAAAAVSGWRNPNRPGAQGADPDPDNGRPNEKANCRFRNVFPRASASATLSPMPLPELLAPAGCFDAAIAAFQYGADAVYAGLDRFSARAEARNLTPERLAVLLAHAHSLTPPRKVYCALNTLLLDAEIPAALDALDILDDLGADAVIVQDWGLFTLARRHFPRLPLHASTQMAAHSRAGVRALADRGFARVVLARELTLGEIAAAAGDRAAEIEVFIHGALCYSYSGLCLFSSHALGRSGNRGRCAYCCRDRLTATETPEAPASHPFSMRDLAWLPFIRRLAAAGVASLKIEGRMKSPLYVAAITDLYRRALDGTLTPAEETRKIADIQTIFSRPWTTLYAETGDADPRAILDPSATGHRGARIGAVQTVLRDRHGGRWIRFRSSRALERHDGIQIEPAAGGPPEGFAVTALRRFGSGRCEIALPAGSDVELQLPPGLQTPPAPGAAVYCSASQEVRRSYPVESVRESSLPPLHACAVTVALDAGGVALSATALGPDPDTATVRLDADLPPARSPGQTEAAARKAFARSRDAGWRVECLDVRDPDARYAPPSLLNEGRRRLLEALQTARASRRRAAREAMRV